MPYQAGGRLPSERASKLGHLDVIHSDLVNKLIDQFEKPDIKPEDYAVAWTPFSMDQKPLRLIFSVDGSIQMVRSDTQPFREVAFVKTALLRLDRHGMEKVDKEDPHPMALRDILAESAIYHATVFPLKNIIIPGSNNYDSVRRIIFDSIQDASLDGEPYKTLKWLAYEKWTGSTSTKSPKFFCPHCSQEIQGLPYDSDIAPCDYCKLDVYLSDVLGFHLEMDEDSAPESVASAYMLIHETLMLFTGVRHFWDAKKFDVLQDCLFIKDGPLTLRSQYSKLVNPIRRFFEHAKQKKINVNMIGQEKSGTFFDHLELIAKTAPERSYFLPSNEYIRKEIQHAPERSEQYGYRTNYGNKLFIKTDKHHQMSLCVPVGEYRDSKNIDDLIGIDRILCTLPQLISHRYEGALLPIQLVNGIASLSSYPSAAVLKVFADF